jgi:hypothetical protein
LRGKGLSATKDEMGSKSFYSDSLPLIKQDRASVQGAVIVLTFPAFG